LILKDFAGTVFVASLAGRPRLGVVLLMIK